MAGETPESVAITEPVASWLLPLDGEACGPDLEYDADFLELNQTAAGKPETQFAPAEPPQWLLVREQAEALLVRTRDLRLALIWARAVLNTDGLPGLLPVLQLFHGLLDAYWDQGLHPMLDPDDGDSFARQSALGSLDKLDGLLGDVRQAQVLNDRRLGGMRVREIEIALERLPPRPDESARTIGQLQGVLGEFPDLTQRVREAVEGSLQVLKQLLRVMNDRVGMDQAVDVKALRLMLEAVKSALPVPADAEGAEGGEGSGEGLAPGGGSTARGGGTLTRIDSRQDAIRAINLVCEYLERSEPTNPAQFLLRRAERLIEKNFLQLVRDLAPEAMAEVARIMGVDPDSIGSED